MLRLNGIILTQFKNYLNRSFEFKEKVIGISGRNGIGKTNLLDAIHYLCFTKSHFTRIDANNILQGHDGFRLEGNFNRWDKHEKATCILRETGKKEFSINDQPYERFSKHIGHYPCVIIAPDDIKIITEGGEERRKFIDTLLSQLDEVYLENLIAYNKILQQRNSLLRSFYETGNKNIQLLEVLDEQLFAAGDKIFEKRKEFLVSFLPAVKLYYQNISMQFENINLFYESELLHAPFAELLRANHAKDMAAMRTTSGVHRDDLEFNLNDQPFKNIASQGQRKSLLFALKLTEMEILKKEKGFSPLLLLDDVFEKLDEARVTNLLQRVCVENDGQVFITDTSEDRLKMYLEKIQVAHEIISL